MNGRFSLLGLWVPGDSVWHRTRPGWKFVTALALTVPALVLQHPAVSAGCLVLAPGALALAGLRPRVAFGLPGFLLVLVGVLAAFQLVWGRPDLAVVAGGNVLLAVYAARLVTLTTPATELVAAIGRAADRLPFVDGERVGLAVGIMLRSIPYLIGAFADVTEAARARGLERRLDVRLTPVVVRAVGFAQATGEALDARGLGQPAGGGGTAEA